MNPHGQKLAALALQLERERTAAKPIVQQLRATIDAVWERDVPEAWRTAGFVHELTTASAEVLDTDARRAASLAALAISIVTMIPPDRYPAVVLAEAEATAWKELANSHWYRSDYASALRALDAADRCLATAPALGLDRAVAQLARALVYSDLRRFDEAEDLLSECEETFRGFRDRKRQGNACSFGG